MFAFKISVAFVLFLALSLCSTKFLESKRFGDRLDQLLARNDGEDCHFCKLFVTTLEKAPIAKDVTPEGLVDWIKNVYCARHLMDKVCIAIRGKELPFAKAFLKHIRGHPEVDPCKEVKIC